jgi:hypothetical protein
MWDLYELLRVRGIPLDVREGMLPSKLVPFSIRMLYVELKV